MKIYIHTGMHKTGTTSFQQALLSKPENLLALGYRVFVNPPMLRLNPNWIREKLKEAEKDCIESFVLSAEPISTFNSNQLSNLLSVFDGYDVILIACFRHWVGFLPSRWGQNCSRRDTQSFPSYFRNLCNLQETHIEARFDIVIDRMVATNPADIRIISYDNAAADDSLLQTLLYSIDLPQEFINEFKGESRRHVSRPQEFYEVLRLFNGVYSLNNAFEPDELFISISRARTVGQFYDISNKGFDVLKIDSVLKNKLSELLEAKNVEIRLSRQDGNISKWEKMAEQQSRGFVINPKQSKLFGDILDSNLVCSDLEVKDIPVTIRQEMADALASMS